MKNKPSIDSQTKIFGILGNPLTHTLSPLIHNFLFSEYKFNGVYLVFETADPSGSLDALRHLKICGLSVTIPYKELAYTKSEIHDEASSYMKAANTLLLGEKISCFNTDGEGAFQAILNHKKKCLEKNGDILILGSGGSAKGIAYSLVKAGIVGKRVVICSRTPEKGQPVANKLNALREGSAEYLALDDLNSSYSGQFSMIINTTPAGMKGYEAVTVLPEHFFSKEQTYFDIVYNPMKTKTIREAKKCGTSIIYGVEMLLYQALRQFKLFTEIEVDAKRIKKLRKRLKKALT